MDYSKKDGGTRVLDAMKARTLATGIGQSQAAARETGSHRAAKVIAGIKPGQLVHDRGLEPHVKARDADAQAMAEARMEQPPCCPDDAVRQFPMASGSKSHVQANGFTTGPLNQSDDQTEQDRVPTTGRHKRMAGLMQAPLNRSGK
jgi:hypothetical protein